MAHEEESQLSTTIITPLWLYKEKQLHMGLASAPRVFQKPNRFNFYRPVLRNAGFPRFSGEWIKNYRIKAQFF